jgi:hypothetical protein
MVWYEVVEINEESDERKGCGQWDVACHVFCDPVITSDHVTLNDLSRGCLACMA